jgi:hypothetical protein
LSQASSQAGSLFFCLTVIQWGNPHQIPATCCLDFPATRIVSQSKPLFFIYCLASSIMFWQHKMDYAVEWCFTSKIQSKESARNMHKVLNFTIYKIPWLIKSNHSFNWSSLLS